MNPSPHCSDLDQAPMEPDAGNRIHMGTLEAELKKYVMSRVGGAAGLLAVWIALLNETADGGPRTAVSRPSRQHVPANS